ncbi:hypothetical protein MNBD_NITROSPIRAE01-477 [hydrothermal vent metagenome]|uniref:Uncharacterized protein n=1 Tax=hydrothermal vent metagenome TaxID=652676 RepID=A0A3B1CIP4_9ZZZZ
MKARRLTFTLSTVLLGFMVITPAFVENSWGHGHHHDKVVIYGESFVDGVEVLTDSGFQAPVPGVTGEGEVLFNIPADGSSPVPLRQVPTLYITEGLEPAIIDESISAENPMRGLAFPGMPNPITYGDWVNIGESKLVVKVLDNGMSKIRMKVKGLLPNSLYTVWQFNVMPGPPGPFGGIPNALATDHKGNASLRRILPFNVLEKVGRLMLIYHSDHSVYGGTPSRINVFAGHDQHVQLLFDLQAAQE